MQTELVTDTSLWIDLHDGEILFSPFELPYEWIVTDFAVLELEERLPNVLDDLYSTGLVRVELEGGLVEKIYELRRSLVSGRRRYRNIKPTDLSALVLAEAKQAPLVTSDGALREFARQRGLSVHGTLWVLDQLVEVHRILKPSHGAQAIHEMLMRNNRLPRDECNDRMVKWRQQDE